MQKIPMAQARRFLLTRQGLLGKSPFEGRQGVLDYIHMTGSVQYDPVDVCGRSHELALFAHVRGYKPEQLAGLLYKDRLLFDYWDKNMCILPIEDWPAFERTRAYFRQNGYSREAIDAVRGDVLAYLREHGATGSQELPLKATVNWPWAPTSLSRAALETLYHRGELAIHHKTRTIKSYALAADCLPGALLNQPDPYPDDADHMAWRVLRRIGAIGLLWNRASDAWLCLELKADARNAAFERLADEGRITAVEVEGKTLWLRSEELERLLALDAPSRAAKHVRFLPPLDCMLWDRKLIKWMFGFAYQWEVYTPAAKRQYAHYALPVLYGEGFAGRAELLRKGDALIASRFWAEEGFRRTQAFDRALIAEADRLRGFHGLKALEVLPSFAVKA